MSMLPGYAALLGDVAGSRRHSDRRGLQRSLRDALDATNQEIPAIVPLAITVGDEMQGLYRRVGEALAAALRVRAHMVGVSPVRFAAGWGVLTVFDPDAAPLGQDGPAWWAARDALEEGPTARRLATVVRPAPRHSRWSKPEGLPHPAELPEAALPLLNAFLSCRDEILGRMDIRDARLLLALLRGQRQAEIARAEGISQAAVSQRYARNGAQAVRRAEEWLREAGV